MRGRHGIGRARALESSTFRIIGVLAACAGFAVVLPLVLAPGALGYRNATPLQRRAVLRAAIHQHKVPAKDAACYSVAISSVDAHWALVAPANKVNCTAVLFAQAFIEHKTASGWVLPKIRYRRMETTSTSTGTALSRCPIGGVPVAVLLDFNQIQPGCPGNK